MDDIVWEYGLEIWFEKLCVCVGVCCRGVPQGRHIVVDKLLAGTVLSSKL